MNHAPVVATIRDFLAKQRVNHRVAVSTLYLIWKMNLLLVGGGRVVLTPAGEEYLATFGGSYEDAS